jgi:hypothetical protein
MPYLFEEQKVFLLHDRRPYRETPATRICRTLLARVEFAQRM